MSNSILTISSCRAELMGIATIMILIGHSIFYGQGFIDYGYLQDIFTLGYSGVDIFLFLSGYGLVYSMQKNEVKDFYKHRLIRIVPSVLAIMAINVIANCKNLSLHFLNPMYWFGSYWYIGFILTAYFVFPVLYKYIYRKGAIAYYCSVLISLLLFLPFLFTGNAGSNAYTCYVTRIPIFVMGACFAMGAFAHLFSTKVITLMGVFGILGLIPFYMSDNLGGNVGMNTYYVFTILTPPIIGILVWILNLGVTHTCLPILRWVGKYSLEIYLIQVTIMPRIMIHLNHWQFNMFENLACSFVIVILASILMKNITDYSISKIVRYK